jgi:two-component system sensor histidine kinase PilS (NtrC family)
MTRLERYLRWYIAIRVVVMAFLLVVYTLFQISPADPSNGLLGPIRNPVFAYTVAMTFGATLVYIALLYLLKRRPDIQAYIQFGGDMALITAMVYFVGGITSPFSLFYLIVIAVASTLLRRRAGINVATVAFLLYGCLVIGLYMGWITPYEALTEPVPPARLNYNLFAHGLGFYGVALLTSYLARSASAFELELEVKSERLADLQVVHRDVIQSISSGLITLDLNGIVTTVNSAGLSILRATEVELLAAPIEQTGLISPETWKDVVGLDDRNRKFRAESELSSHGERVYVGYTVSRLTDGFGTHRGYIMIFQDLTGARQMQEELRLKDRMAAVGELAAGLAHEIGNPLAAISGSVQMLAGAGLADPGQRKLIDILLRESQRLDRTIKSFLRFARPKEGARVPFDIAHLLTENFELLKNSQEVSAHHRLALDVEPQSASLVGDPDQVSQIFWNLARNALRAMPGGGMLTVVGRLEGAVYRFSVVDTGRGMSEEQRANLFHPYHSFFDGGTGIGMAIVYRIVQAHGGRIAVESDPGLGAAVTVELPVSGFALPSVPGPEIQQPETLS